MKRRCGCYADVLVFGHTECDAAPRWIVRRISSISYWLRAETAQR